MKSRAIAVVVAFALFAVSGRAARADVARELQRAADLLQQGDYDGAERIATRIVLAGPDLEPDVRAEGWRIYGLALFFLDRKTEAEHALFEFLKRSPDAVLDPALVPPEAIRFFEDVRLAHEEELVKYRPRPKRKRYWALTLVPPAGQFQNGDRAKGWIISGLGVALIATNVATYLTIRGWCDNSDDTCEDDAGNDRAEDARKWRRVNYAAGAGLIALYLYGVVDGYYGHRNRVAEERRGPEERSMVFDIRPTGQGAVFVLGGTF
jgi:hypothetical protein